VTHSHPWLHAEVVEPLEVRAPGSEVPDELQAGQAYEMAIIPRDRHAMARLTGHIWVSHVFKYSYCRLWFHQRSDISSGVGQNSIVNYD
jgi:hypothetical protein